ncbi:YceG family protein [Actinomycetes bacterium NPDC127524]
MGAFGQYSKINPVLISFKEDEWKNILEKKRAERQPFQAGDQEIAIGQLAARLLGIRGDEDEYYNELFELSRKSFIYVLDAASMNKEIAPEQFQAIQSVLLINQNESLSVNRFVAFLEGKQLIPVHENSAVNRHIRECLIHTLQEFAKHHNDGLKHPDFRRVIVDLIKWMRNHMEPALRDMQDDRMPAFLWYGDGNKSEGYFLYYLTLFGFDVLIFHPGGKDLLKELELDPEHNLMIVHEHSINKEPRAFPKGKSVRKATVAYQASREIERILHTDETPIFKPWQYRSYQPHSITLKTTYDELFLVSREKAFIRPNFSIEGNKVHIPSIFAKISGISENKREYWDRLEEMKEGELTLFIRYFPLTANVGANHQYHYHHALNADGMLDPEKMMKSVWWKLGQLPLGVQQGVASAISRVCGHPKLLAEGSESLSDIQLYLFTQLTVLPASVVALLVKFDYPQSVPRIVMYNSGSGSGITRPDAALLLLLNEIGIDLILYNPSGLRDLEMYIDEQYYDVHLMEHVEFDCEYKEPKIPIWRRFFK